ncbi:hypothetical protein LTS08_002054 [Lithohypha guttulata]|nr:hypothetical protein LTS08_002054 [Lithohypha guttulata]
MREVIRGSRAHDTQADAHQALANVDPTSPSVERVARLDQQEADNGNPPENINIQNQTSNVTRVDSETAVASPSPGPSRQVAFRTDSKESGPARSPLSRDRRRSSSFFRNNSETRPEAEAYYDSRAATKREWRRRATTLQDYYQQNPELLPQLPFTWHRGKKRWRLIFLIVLMWIDACIIPIALYYAMRYGGNIEGWIIFAIVTTIWGGPTYLEFGVRTIKLIKKERFYRPLGTNSRWSFDYLNWVSVATITVVTSLFIIGSAPHEVWLRVLCMPMPALLYCLGGFAGFPTLYNHMGWKAPFRMSSTAKGEIPKPGVYYFMEDTVAVNANAGRPYREALAARYEASPRFREMIYNQSLFWSIPPIIIAIPLTIISVINPVPATVAYGITWAIPFIWATVWGLVSLRWCKRDMVRERIEWESTQGPLDGKFIGLETDNSSQTPEQAV